MSRGTKDKMEDESSPTTWQGYQLTASVFSIHQGKQTRRNEESAKWQGNGVKEAAKNGTRPRRFFTVYGCFLPLVSFLALLFPRYLHITMHLSFFGSVLAGGGTFDLCRRGDSQRNIQGHEKAAVNMKYVF